MACDSSDAARGSRPNCGWRREPGAVRTSTRRPIPAAPRMARNSSIDCVPCPTVKITGDRLLDSSAGVVARSHRLVAEDTTLSRWRHGFKSRWDYQRKRVTERLRELEVVTLLVTLCVESRHAS